MEKTITIGIKGKILLTIIPILICSFTIIAFVSITSARQNLFNISNHFMKYKIEQISIFSSNQWKNLKESGFSEDPAYTNIVQKSIESYAKNMIKKKSEYIFAINSSGNLIFSTSNINYNPKEWNSLNNNSSTIEEFIISGKTYIGLSYFDPDIDLIYFITEDKKVFFEKTNKMTYLQIITFITSLILIILALFFSLEIIIGPIQRVRKAIHNISVYKDFSRKVRIEYPDEIGELAFDFNSMTSNLHLAYNKLKKHALNEAIAKKEIFARENETLHILGKASDYKDPETGAHIARVSNYSLIISKSLGQNKAMQDLLNYAAPLHDIGKLGISDSILLKPGRLSADEFDIMKTHTSIGYEILENQSSKYLKAGAVIAMSHHEKYDGTGYPKGLKGDDIPIFGRIVSIADVFDALTTKRPYKEAWPFEKALDLIREERGKHFDPGFVDIFVANRSKIRQILDSYKTTPDSTD